jgi:hypothetical protein
MIDSHGNPGIPGTATGVVKAEDVELVLELRLVVGVVVLLVAAEVLGIVELDIWL